MPSATRSFKILPLACVVASLLLVASLVVVRFSGAQLGWLSGYIELINPGFISEQSWLRELRRAPASHGYSIYGYLQARGTDSAVDLAEGHLLSKDPYLWLNAALYLGSRNRQEAVPYLIKSIRHSAYRSVGERVDMLRRITGREFGEDFQRWRTWFEEEHPGYVIDWDSSLSAPGLSARVERPAGSSASGE